MSDDDETDLFLVELMRTADTEIKIALEFARLAHKHSGNVGDNVEAAMRSVVERFLPRNLYVGHGEVVDKVATRSHQVDVVVANDLQPFRLASDAPGLYLVEGVSAVGEIKSRLTTAELDDCIRKGSRSKTLRFRAHKGSTASANPSDAKRFYYSPPFFVVAVESQVATQTLLDRLAAVSRVESPDGVGPALDPIDAVFVIQRGVAINYGDGQGAAQMVVGGSNVSGWVFYDSETVLAELVLWLHRTMPRIQMPYGSPVHAYVEGRSVRNIQFPSSHSS